MSVFSKSMKMRGLFFMILLPVMKRKSVEGVFFLF